MGKGGTKFVGEAVSHRHGRRNASTGKERQKNMEKFLESGVHPEIAILQRQNEESQLLPLPEYDANRLHVFLDISISNKPAGCLVVELFDDILPAAATSFKNRCLPGASDGLHHTTFHKLLPHFAVYGGQSGHSSTLRMMTNNRLRALERGLVMVALVGSEVVITLTRTLALERTHQVVGRISEGKEVLDQLDELPTTPDDAPLYPIRIAKCGLTTHRGLQGTSGGPTVEETQQEAQARMDLEADNARQAVLEALEVGLGSKRKPQDAPASSQARPIKKPPARYQDSLLEELESDTSGEGSEEEGGDS